MQRLESDTSFTRGESPSPSPVWSSESSFYQRGSVGSVSSDGIVSSLFRRSKDTGEEDSDPLMVHERRSPLPPDADLATALDWLRKEMTIMRSQDQQLLREFMKIRAGIQLLKSQQQQELSALSPVSSRSSTPDLSVLPDFDRSMSPAPAKAKKTVVFRVRSSTTPSSVLHSLTKADGPSKSPSMLASPRKSPGLKRSPAIRLGSTSSSASADWEFVSSSISGDADTFMSELNRSLGTLGTSTRAFSGDSTVSAPAGGALSPSPIGPASPPKASGAATGIRRSSFGNKAIRRSHSPVTVIADVNEGSSEC